ncbi:MAG: glycosyltransferase [Gemmatimonadaceae bacterium]
MTADVILLAIACALPWVVAPAVILWRARDSRHLDAEPAEAPPGAPRVTIIIPARDEARNIARCVRSVLASTYSPYEVIVVDDHSTDGTAVIARKAGAGDDRLRVIAAPELPQGWFGKSWACATGAGAASGELLGFTDADTLHAPDLLGRATGVLLRDRFALLSVAGRQELGSFWERVVQPHVFLILLARYGGSETMRRSRNVEDKIANGQFMLVRRSAYEHAGGHAAVRDRVAEDLMLAQRVFASGGEVALAIGLEQLSTRMYRSLGELVRGWRKNVYAGGRNAIPAGVPRAFFPLALLAPPALALLPVMALVCGAAGLVWPGVTLWGAFAAGGSALWWAVIYRFAGESVLYALAYPLGAAVLLYILAGALARGERVQWKGRAYRSG